MKLLATGLTAACLLTGCAVSGTPTAAPAGQEWRQAVFEAVAGLGAQLGPIGAEMANPDRTTNYTALHSACNDMRDYVDTMQHRVLPGPDIQINEALQGGIDGFREMADHCAELTPANSSTRLRRLAAAMDDADTHLKDAIRMLNAAVPQE